MPVAVILITWCSKLHFGWLKWVPEGYMDAHEYQSDDMNCIEAFEKKFQHCNV